jgi:hypothetical protein
LCGKLDTAAAVEARGDTATRDGALNAYRNQLDAQTGKSVTAAAAALLKFFSTALQVSTAFVGPAPQRARGLTGACLRRLTGPRAAAWDQLDAA